MVSRTNWRVVFAAYAVGVAGAVQVGRIAPVATDLKDALQISLVTVGWLVSLITLASAVFGLITGYWVGRAGLRASLVIGALIIGSSAMVAALVPAVQVLIGARIAEGIGYLIVVVAAPTLIAREASTEDMPFALALWGTFFTLGLSLSAFAGSSISEQLGWRVWFFASAAVVVFTALIAWVSIQPDTRAAADRSNQWKIVAEMTKASWFLGAAFLGVTLLALSIVSLLPTFLVQTRDFSAAAAGSVTGAVALASIVGSLGYGAAATRFSDKMIAVAATFTLIVSAYFAFSIAKETGQIIAFAAIAVLMTGVLVAQTFAAVPKVAGAQRHVGPTNGLVAQLGSVGALIGPPLIGGLVISAGWIAVPWVVAAFALSFTALFFLALNAQSAASQKDVT